MTNTEAVKFQFNLTDAQYEAYINALNDWQRLDDETRKKKRMPKPASFATHDDQAAGPIGPKGQSARRCER